MTRSKCCSFVLTLVVALTAMGCGSMEVRRLGADAAIEGLRVQVPVPHEVVTVTHQDGEQVLGFAVMMLPSKDEFYELDMRGGTFRSRVLKVSLHPNGTLKTYSFTSKEKVGEALQQSADAVDTLAGAAKEIAESQQQANPLVDENASIELEILNSMLRANQEALEEGRPLPYPGILGID